MFPKVVRRGLAALSSLVIAGTVALTLPTSADAAASRAYGGSAYGSSGKLGNTVNLGRTANQPFCTTASNVGRRNFTEATEVEGLGRVGAQTTTTRSVKTSTRQQSITTSETAGLDLFDGAVSLTGLKSTATVTLDRDGYKLSGKTEVLGLRINRLPPVDVPTNPEPNRVVPIPGLGRLILNQQGTINKYGIHSQGVNGLRLIIDENTLGVPTGTVVFSYSLASLHSPTFRRAFGVAYTTKVQVGTVVQSGATAVVNLPCGGSSGATLTNNIAALFLPGVIDVGAGETRAVSNDSSTSTTAATSAKLGRVNLLGVVTATGVRAVSTTTKKGSTYTRSSAGTTVLDLKINGSPVSIAAGTSRTISGVGVLSVGKRVTTSQGLEVTALELVLSQDRGSLRTGTKLTVGFAQSGVA